MAPRNKGVVIPISSTDDTGRSFASVNEKIAQLQARVRQLSGEGGRPGDAIAGGMRHAVPEVAAASGAIRELEGNLPIRAIERFLTTTLGLGPALSAAFPVIGAIALVGVIGEGVGKVIEMKKRSDELGKAIAENASTVVAAERQKVDALAVTNDKLEEQIAKFEHKPVNGLATAADEARVEIDKLDESIRGAVTDSKKLFDEKFKVGTFDRVFGGVKSTDPAKNEVTKTLSDIDAIRSEYSRVLNQAQDGGATPENIDRIKQAELSRIQAKFDASSQALSKLRIQAQNQQEDSRRLGGDGKEFDPLLNSIQGALDLYEQQQKGIGQEYRGSVDAPKVAQLRADKDNGDAARKAEEAERKAEALRRAKAEADEKFAAAERLLADANARALAAAQKAGTDRELDVLESAHRAQLVSDEDFYKKREEIQARGIANERAKVQSERLALQLQAFNTGVSGAGLTGNDKTINDAKILELRAKIRDLDIADSKLTDEAAKNTRARADAETDLARKRLAAADQLAATLEGERGGGVSARQTQSRDEFRLRRAAAGSDPTVLANLDQQQKIDQDKIGVTGAEQDSDLGDVNRKRRDVTDQLERGQITAQQAQQQKIALDREEAQAMQPLLAAYQKLAADGDLAAVDKVADLQQKIAELKNPVNEVALEIRNQFDSAFEGFFENIARGRDALKSLGDAIAKDATKDLYQQFIRPQVQSLGGLLIPNRVGNPALPGGDEASAAPASMAKSLGSILAGFPGLGGLAGKGKDGDKQVTIKIENKADTPVSAETASGSFDGESYVVGIVLKNLSEGGSLAKAFGIG